MRVMYITNMINSRNVIHEHHSRLTYHHPLARKLSNTLNQTPSGIFVHWGVYESGKSTAARNAGLRLQNDSDRLVILLDCYDFSWKPTSMRAWLRHRIGIPEFIPDSEPMSTFFNKPTTIIMDHFDLLMRDKQQSVNDTLNFIRELATESAETQKFNVLLVVTSWERAIELRNNGCTVLESPSRWTEAQLKALFASLPAAIQEKYNEDTDKKDRLLRLSTLSGTPGYLTFSAAFDSEVCPRHASILDLEWRKGTDALCDKSLGDTGRFPDKDGIFHHEDLRSIPIPVQ